MRKLLVYISLVMPAYLSAQNLVYNPGFDMENWDAGWTQDTAIYSSTGDTQQTLSIIMLEAGRSMPNCGYLYTKSTGIHSGGYHLYSSAQAILYQEFIPILNCTCKMYLKWDLSAVFGPLGKYACTVLLSVNRQWQAFWIQDSLCCVNNWTEICTTLSANDTIRGIKFIVSTSEDVPPMEIGLVSVSAKLWVDDVSITGKIVGVEESVQNSTFNPQISIWPNPFTQQTAICKESTVNNNKGMKIKIYDISGKMVEYTDEMIIGKDLQPGIYFVEMGNHTPIKIIKLKK